MEIKKSKPAIGWAKASDISDKDSRLKIGELMEENRLLRENLSVHEKKDFRPILEGLSGKVELQKFEFSGAEINDSWPFDREPNLEVRKGFDKYLYQPIGEPFQKPASWIMERICFGFLFGRDFESAVKKGLASPHPIGTPNSIVCAPTDEHSLEPLFMALEGTGLLRPGEPYGSMSELLFGRKNDYLRRTPWALSEDFRRWIVKQGNQSVEF